MMDDDALRAAVASHKADAAAIHGAQLGEHDVPALCPL